MARVAKRGPKPYTDKNLAQRKAEMAQALELEPVVFGRVVEGSDTELSADVQPQWQDLPVALSMLYSAQGLEIPIDLTGLDDGKVRGLIYNLCRQGIRIILQRAGAGTDSHWSQAIAVSKAQELSTGEYSFGAAKVRGPQLTEVEQEIVKLCEKAGADAAELKRGIDEAIAGIVRRKAIKAFTEQGMQPDEIKARVAAADFTPQQQQLRKAYEAKAQLILDSRNAVDDATNLDFGTLAAAAEAEATAEATAEAEATAKRTKK